MGKKQVKDYINQYVGRLKAILPSCKIILYGSYIKNSYRMGESDVDLLVIAKEFHKMKEDERFDLLYKNTVGLPLDWHVYGFTPHEAKTVGRFNLFSEALRKGKIIT